MDKGSEEMRVLVANSRTREEKQSALVDGDWGHEGLSRAEWEEVMKTSQLMLTYSHFITLDTPQIYLQCILASPAQNSHYKENYSSLHTWDNLKHH